MTNLEDVKLSKRKPARIDHMLYDTIYMNGPKEANSLTQKSCYLGTHGEASSGHEFLWEVIKMLKNCGKACTIL